MAFCPCHEGANAAKSNLAVGSTGCSERLVYECNLRRGLGVSSGYKGEDIAQVLSKNKT